MTRAPEPGAPHVRAAHAAHAAVSVPEGRRVAGRPRHALERAPGRSGPATGPAL
jgi:hypothetical protein